MPRKLLSIDGIPVYRCVAIDGVNDGSTSMVPRHCVAQPARNRPRAEKPRMWRPIRTSTHIRAPSENHVKSLRL